jgi:hypothetical protein
MQRKDILEDIDFECHYNPPTAFMHAGKTFAVFPVVKGNNWCGKYEQNSKSTPIRRS